MRQISEPERHNIYKLLSKYGNPKDIIKKMELEKQMGSTTKIKSYTIYKSWIIKTTKSSIDAINIDNLIWIFIGTAKVKKIEFCYMDDNYGLTLCYKNRDIHYSKIGSFHSSKKMAKKIIEAIHNDKPWICTEYSKELASLWSYDFDKFVQLVDDKKESVPLNL